MIVGIPKETKDHELRVALLPDAVPDLIRAGHTVLLQSGAGCGCGYSDREYQKAGATLLSNATAIWANSDLVVKVKEPTPAEYPLFRRGLRLFCYLHLAANRRLTKALLRSGVFALGFETLQDSRGDTPLLKPMSEIAGRLSAVLGANLLRTDLGGRGVLLSPTQFSMAGTVVVVGGGNVGRAAAEVAAGMGGSVWVFDLYPKKLSAWRKRQPRIEVFRPSHERLTRALSQADLAIGAVYIPGARAPKVIRRSMVRNMQPGSVLVDVAVDQGGAAETTRPTSISDPTYKCFGVIHSAIPNLPTLVCRTASQALSRTILPYVLRVAGIKRSEDLLRDRILKTAVNIAGGKIIHPRVMEAVGSPVRGRL